MKSDTVLDHPDSFEARLRSGLDRVSAADPIREPGRFDPDMMRLAVDDPQPRRPLVPMLAAAAAIVAVTVAGLTLFASRGAAPTVADQPTVAVTDPADTTATPPSTSLAGSTETSEVTASSLFGLDAAGWHLAQLVLDDGGTFATYMKLDEMTDETGGPVMAVSTGTGLSLDPVVAASWDRLEQTSEVQVLGGMQEMRSGISDTVHAVRWGTTNGVEIAVSAADMTSAEAAELLNALRVLTPEEAAQVLADYRPEPTPTSTVTIPLTPSASLEALAPSQEYFAAVWDAREIVIGNCMAQLGYDYRARPNDASGTGGTWDEWNHWHNQQLAANPDFDAALFGAVDEQVGGCQAEAYLAVHGPGEEAYSKAASLENELRGDIDWLELDQTAVDRWVADHAEDVERVRAELDEELQTARSIIENADS
jgi:hypothetical protein